MNNLQRALDHDGQVEVGEGVFVGHAFEEKLIDIVVFNAFGHLLIEVSGFARPPNLYINFLLALMAILALVKPSSIVWAETLGARLVRTNRIGACLSHL